MASALLNHKQKAFAAAYAIGPTAGNGTKSAIAAGYSVRTAADAGCRLLTNPEILALIEAKTEKVATIAEVKAADVLSELKVLAYSNVISLYNDEKCEKCGACAGTLKHPKDMPLEVQRSIKKLKFTELFDGASGEKFVAGRIVEIELHSKETGLVKLGEHLGLFKQTVVHEAGESLADLLGAARAPEPKE